MKKIFAFCVFAFLMIVGTQSISAQNKLEINALASKKTEVLRKQIKFDDVQRDKIYRVYQRYERIMADINNAENKNVEAEKKANLFLESEIKGILNDEQFDRYKSAIQS